MKKLQWAANMLKVNLPVQTYDNIDIMCIQVLFSGNTGKYSLIEYC